MSTRTHTIMAQRQRLRDQIFDRYWQDGTVYYTVKPGWEKVAEFQWKEHGVCPQCFRWSIACGRCCCGWQSAEYKERVAAEAARKAKHEQEIADAIAEYEEEQAALAAKRRK